ncbi:MAG: carbohydrate kinase [Saprospiraceae bacterium]
MHNKTAVCFGEVLWDLLPAGAVAGGAPMNVACQLTNLGLKAIMISSVGNDDLGRQLLDFLRQKGVDTSLIGTDPEFPTGTVNVSLDDKGIPSYEIVQPVAWDYIDLSEAALDAVGRADAFVFGSLAARSETTLKTLEGLLEAASFPVFDVNLRAPFYEEKTVNELLKKALLLKLNDEEIDILCGWRAFKGGQPAQMEFLKDEYHLDAVVLTRGAKGAALLDDSGLYEHSGYRVQVADTVGSGDAFLAGFLSQWLGGASPLECLSFACATGALVATLPGGTPDIDASMVRELMHGSTPHRRC